MSRNTETGKHANDNFRPLDPVQELKVIDLGMVDDRLSSTAKVLWHRLVRWTNNKPDHRYAGCSWAGREKLGEWIGRKERTITTCTGELKRAGLIIVKRRPNESNLIKPNWPVIDSMLDRQKSAPPDRQGSAPPDGQESAAYRTDQHRTDSHSTDQGLHTHSDERVETCSGSGEDPSGAPADVLDGIDFSACVVELEKNLPPFEAFNDFKPLDQKRLQRVRRGATFKLKELCRLGWNLGEIRQYLNAYRRDFDEQAKTNFKRNGQCGKTLAGLLSQLVYQCDPETRNNEDGEIYGWHIPNRFLQRKGDKPALNDNAKLDRASGDGSTYGGESDLDAPF